MKKNDSILYVKNMVCNRCIKVVKDGLNQNKIEFNKVKLGKIYFKRDVSENEVNVISQFLLREGFQLLVEKEERIINQVKSIIIGYIHHGKEKPLNQNYSNFLSTKIGIEYTHISKLFSETEGKTIEQYVIEQRIEKAKEFLEYNELNLSQISYLLNYSSPQHLSRQFKKITGMTPTEYKKSGKRKKLDTI